MVYLHTSNLVRQVSDLFQNSFSDVIRLLLTSIACTIPNIWVTHDSFGGPSCIYGDDREKISFWLSQKSWSFLIYNYFWNKFVFLFFANYFNEKIVVLISLFNIFECTVVLDYFKRGNLKLFLFSYQFSTATTLLL